MSDILQTRLSRLNRLVRLRARIIRASGSLEAAQEHPQWTSVNLLISVLRNRIETSLEPENIAERLSPAEIAFVTFLINNIQEL